MQETAFRNAVCQLSENGEACDAPRIHNNRIVTTQEQRRGVSPIMNYELCIMNYLPAQLCIMNCALRIKSMI